MKQRYEIKRMANIKTPDGADAVFYEVWDLFEVDERTHRNHDRAFKTREEAQAWIDKQSD